MREDERMMGAGQQQQQTQVCFPRWTIPLLSLPLSVSASRFYQKMDMESRELSTVSLFGMIGELDQTKTLFTLISLIGILLVFDTFLEMIEYFAEDAGYNGLLQKLYKEMMSEYYLRFVVSIVSFLTI